MLATAIIVFREVLEASLIICIVMAATKGVPSRGRWVSAGTVAGIAGAVIVALFADQIASAAEGGGQEIFNATVLFVAVIMLAWHNIWMNSHGREMATTMKQIGAAVRAGSRPMYALAIVCGIAVLREGSEIVLFLYGIASSGTGAIGMLIGGIIGVIAGAAFGTALYYGLLRIPLRHLFTVTNWIILLLASGMAAQGASFLVQANLLPALGSTMWDTSWLLTEGSILGKVLHTLVGYTARPSGIQLVFYFVTLITILTLMKLFNRKPQPAPARAAPDKAADDATRVPMSS
ncbi:MAG TPA: FTR1 family protein [Burkholderiales bacterium]|jgi:high-affinity iron transporter|nr:FTR1 family protein [Burkholderiales bacterium]